MAARKRPRRLSQLMLKVPFDTPSTTCLPAAPPTLRTLRRTALYRARSFTGDREQEKKLLDAIQSCDLDGDGLVSFAELKSFLHSIGWRGKDAYIADLLRQLDVNKDGKVTVAECVACAGLLRSLWALRGDRVRAVVAGAHCLIFLGGSCNPTTWRKDIAIPIFEAAGISDYYNPQVDNWTPDLVQKEAIAKASADILFFVVDNKTRAMASMIEVAEHVACAVISAKRVVVVVKDVEEGASMNGELIDATQRDDLNRARAYLADVIRRYPRGSSICATVVEGAQLCATIHAELVAAAASPAAPRSVVPPLPPTSDDDARSRGGGAPLHFIEAIKASDVDGDGFLSREELKGFLVSIGWIGDDHELSSLLKRIHLGADEMSTVTIAECVACAEMLQTWWASRYTSSSATGSINLPLVICSRPIFLGGSCNPTTWRLDVTIPQFEAAGIGPEHYINPQVAEWTEDLVSKEAAMKLRCGIYLYVVDAKTRALASMVEAAELVVNASRSSTHVVLVIHDVAPGYEFAGIATSASQLRDLNRARAYLADVTSRHATVVLNSVAEATRYVIQLWQHFHFQACAAKRAAGGAAESGAAP